jgi:hypothetical protein
MAVIAYVFGMFIFAILYFIFEKIISFFDPYPPNLPIDCQYAEECKCKILVNWSVCDCVKTSHIMKRYHYDSDCNVIECESAIASYKLRNPMKIEFCNPMNKIEIIELPERKAVECYADNSYVTYSLYSINAERKESVYSYRKIWKRNKATSQ